MIKQDSVYTLAEDILKKIGGDVTKSYDSTYSICLAILEKLGGDVTKNYDSTYSIVEAILPLAGEGKCNLDVLKVIANGTYNPAEGFDGFSSVEVAVPLPVIENNKTQKIVQNGDTIIIPTEGNDAMKQATVTIEVPTGEAIDVRKSVTINKNGVTNINPAPGFGGIEGADVMVEVTPDLESLNETITENGTKSFVSTKDGYSSVDITTNVQPKLQDKIEDITNNGIFNITPDLNFDGLNKATVNVNVPERKPEEKGNETITANGLHQYTPTAGHVFNAFDVTVDIPLEENKTQYIFKNGVHTVTPNEGNTAMKQATITVEVPEQKPEEVGNETIVSNGKVKFTPTPGSVFSEMNVDVQVPGLSVEEEQTINQRLDTIIG